MKLEFKKDVEFIFRDYNDEFNHCKMIIKRGTIIDVDEDESEVHDYCPGVEFDKFYHISFYPGDYNENEVKIEIIQQSENDENDVDELRSELCSIYINYYDVFEV